MSAMSTISPKATIESGVYIGHNVVIYGSVTIKRSTIIEDNCIIGKPSRTQLAAFRKMVSQSESRLTPADYDSVVTTATTIGENVTIQSNCIIYAGVTLGDEVLCEDYCTVRWESTIEHNTAIRLNGFIGAGVKVGEHSRVSGISGNGARIGRYVTMTGSLLHAYHRYGGGRTDPAPVLEDYVNVGRGAMVVGKVTVGQYSYLAAGAIASKDVPPKTFVTGVNQHRTFAEWAGAESYITSFPVENQENW